MRDRVITKNKPELKPIRRRLRSSPTEAERIIWNLVRGGQLGVRFFRQYSLGDYILDFFCPKFKLCIEVDGGQHNQPVQRRSDKKRTQFLNTQGVKVIRFWNNEVTENQKGVYQKISEFITPSNSPLS